MLRSGVPLREDQALAVELAGRVVGRIAPDEAPIFAEIAAEYFQDPGRAVGAGTKDEPLGFGVDLALLGPYALAVALPVVEFLGAVGADLAKDLLKDSAKEPLGRLVRRMFRRAPAEQVEPPIVLSDAQLRWVRDATLRNATALGLPDDRARLLADATAGSLNRAPR